MKKKEQEVLIETLDRFKEALEVYLKGSWSDEEMELAELINALLKTAKMFIDEPTAFKVVDSITNIIENTNDQINAICECKINLNRRDVEKAIITRLEDLKLNLEDQEDSDG